VWLDFKHARAKNAWLRLRNSKETGFNNCGRICEATSHTLHLPDTRPGGKDMSKGLDQKKDAKKKPAKTLKEKRAEKQAKKKG
jgi:hypothetical protein